MISRYMYKKYLYLQSWPKLCGTSLQNALPRPSISFSHGNKRSLGQILPSPPPPPMQCCSLEKACRRVVQHCIGGEGGSERILQQFGKKALCPTHFGQDCSILLVEVLRYFIISSFSILFQNIWLFSLMFWDNRIYIRLPRRELYGRNRRKKRWGLLLFSPSLAHHIFLQVLHWRRKWRRNGLIDVQYNVHEIQFSTSWKRREGECCLKAI